MSQTTTKPVKPNLNSLTSDERIVLTRLALRPMNYGSGEEIFDYPLQLAELCIDLDQVAAVIGLARRGLVEVCIGQHSCMLTPDGEEACSALAQGQAA